MRRFFPDETEQIFPLRFRLFSNQRRREKRVQESAVVSFVEYTTLRIPVRPSWLLVCHLTGSGRIGRKTALWEESNPIMKRVVWCREGSRNEKSWYIYEFKSFLTADFLYLIPVMSKPNGGFILTKYATWFIYLCNMFTLFKERKLNLALPKFNVSSKAIPGIVYSANPWTKVPWPSRLLLFTPVRSSTMARWRAPCQICVSLIASNFLSSLYQPSCFWQRFPQAHIL